MRLVAWNCADAFRRKTGHLLRLSPDIAVISEARKECLDALDGSSTSAIWAGDGGAKGLAIVGFNGWRITSCETMISERWFLPAIAERGPAQVQIVGVWVKPANGYVAPTIALSRQSECGVRSRAGHCQALSRCRRCLQFDGSEECMALCRDGRYALWDLERKQAIPHRLCVRSRMAWQSYP
jgi:hypothetical protein